MTQAVLMCLPPALDPSEGVFAPDPARWRWIGRILRGAETARRAGNAVAFDLGTSGLRAAEIAGRAASAGIARAAVFGGPFDRAAAEVLAAALNRVGIAAELCIDDGRGSAGRRLEALSVAAAVVDRPPPRFDDPLPEGPAPRAAEDALIALVVDEPGTDDVAAAIAAAHRNGADRLRLVLDPPRRGPPADADRPAWWYRAGLDDVRLRSRVDKILAAAIPGRRFAFARACADAEEGVDRRLSAYRGDAVQDPTFTDAAGAFEFLCEAWPELRSFAGLFAPAGVRRWIDAARAAEPRFVVVEQDSCCTLRTQSIPADASALAELPPAGPSGRTLLLPLPLGADTAERLRRVRAAALPGGRGAGVVPFFVDLAAIDGPCAVPAPPAGERELRELWMDAVRGFRPERAFAVDAAARCR